MYIKTRHLFKKSGAEGGSFKVQRSTFFFGYPLDGAKLWKLNPTVLGRIRTFLAFYFNLPFMTNKNSCKKIFHFQNGWTFGH